MERSTQQFIEHLVVGPSFLLVGQSASIDPNGSDSVLAAAVQAAGLSPTTSVATIPADDRRRVFEQLAEASRAAAIPPPLEQIAAFRWNGVFTSMVDSRATRAFAADWRRVTTSVGDQRVRHPRSSIDLTIRLLFGGTGEPPERWPPTTGLEMASRRSDAHQALAELTNELITPRGVLAIDGWQIGDWLSSENLYAAVMRLRPGQVHLFSIREDTRQDEFIAGAIAKGFVVPHDESLASLLKEAGEEGRLLPFDEDVDAHTRVLKLGDRLVPVPRDQWSRIITSARPIDAELLSSPAPLVPDLEYQRFRAFLGHTEGTPDWTGVAAGYPFRRFIEIGLFERVQRQLGAAEPGSPIIVEGQAGSGKSVALTVLAARVASQGNVAVLHVGRFGERPSVAAIDQFSLWAEEEGALATLVVWDGMADVDDYYAAYQQLRSRGRRTLIVGSAYRLASPRQGAIMVPGKLEGDEPERIRGWLARFGVELRDVDLALVGSDASFLAALYRLLPDSRRGIERGLTLELRAVEADMEQYARQRAAEPTEELTVMAAALLRAGVELPSFEAAADDRPVQERDFRERSTAEQLTGLVLVAGRRGLRVPLDLVLRVVGREGSGALLDTVKRFDIVRWSSDDSGNQYLGARTALEAELLARSDLRDARAEVEIMVAFLSEVKPSPGNGGPEVQFALDLLRLVGADGPEAGRFARHYLTLADALATVREAPGREHARLILQESNLRREFVVRATKRDAEIGLDQTARLKILRQTQAVLESALDGSPPSALRQNLLVELASTIGSEAWELSQVVGEADSSVARLAARIVEIVNQARALDPENYYPVDVIGWVCMTIVRNGAVGLDLQIGLVADMMAAFASIDTNALSPNQRARYNSRLAQVSGLMNNAVGESEHLEALRENSDPAAFYLLALHKSRLLFGEATAESARVGLKILTDAPPEVRMDWRCARLTLDLFWLARTGRRFLEGEREALAFDDDDWNACLDIIEQVQLAPADAYRAQFLRGLALFHLRRYRLAIEAFSDLERATPTMSRRVVATYVVSAPDGTPVAFTGQVRSVTPDNRRGRVWVEAIGQELTFIPIRFTREELARGDPLPDFFIAFNFRGAYADPVRVARPTRPSTKR